MKCLVLRGFSDMIIQERPRPEPAAGEAMVRIATTGICGSDIHGYTGENGRRSPGQVMGHETSGFVERLGPGTAADMPTGARVTVNPVLACGQCDGCRSGQDQTCDHRTVIGVDPDLISAFAQFIVVPVANVVPLGQDVPIQYGALVEPLAVGQHALRRGQCGPNDRVLVIGGGPIGQACFLAARRQGAEVLVSESHQGRVQLLSALGAVTVGPLSAADRDHVAEVLGGAPTLVVDAVGSATTLNTGLALTRPGARIVLVGMQAPQIDLAAYLVTTMERSIIGSFTYSASDFRATSQWVSENWTALKVLIEKVVPMNLGPSAFEESVASPTAGKILIDMSADTDATTRGAP